MKKLFSLVIALGFLFAGSTFGQDATVNIPDVMHSSGTIEVPVEVDFTLKDVCTFQFYIHFNNDYLEFQGVENEALPGNWSFNGAGSPSPILISWFSLDPANFEGKLLDLVFTYNGGNTDIWFGSVAPEDSSVGDCAAAGDYPDVIFNNGSVSLAPPVPLSNWAVLAGLGLILAFVIVRLGRFF